MLRSKSFAKKTRKGNVVKVVKEHYLRHDISTGVGTSLESNASCYLIPDTNVALHQIDFLENAAITNVIILQTVLDEVKNQNVSIYNRVKHILKNEKKHFYLFSNEHHAETYIEREKNESMNDRNDRAIRVAALWYMRKLSEGIPILLLTNDKANLEKAKDMEINSQTVYDYTKSLKDHPELLDILNYSADSNDQDSGNSSNLTDDASTNGGVIVEGKMATRRVLFEEHKPLSEIMKGITPSNPKYFQGTIQVNRNNPNEASIEVSGLPQSSYILIKGFKNINRSVHNDVVAVELLPNEQWTGESSIIIDHEQQQAKNVDINNQDVLQRNSSKKIVPTGKVVGIIKRNWKPYCGSIDEDTDIRTGLQTVLFVPVDKRIPRIRIKTRQVKELISKRITVMMDAWHTNSMFPEGHYVSTLGDIGNMETESEVILLEHDIPHYQFSDTVLKCLPPSDWKITEEEIQRRKDIRHLVVCSVDPPGCTDIDDALHFRELENGNYEVGVHIADVTHFVKDGTALDDEAAKRSTSVYLVDRRIDMLPKILTENLCSLVSGEDRLAFSVLWELSPDVEIVKTQFSKTVIRSKASLTYEQAQTLIDDKSQQTEIAKNLRGLLRISRILKKRRMKDGALNLASEQVKFDLNTETLNPTDVEMYQMRETNSMVEEFMLFANISVAKQIYQAFPNTACLRRHPEPYPEKFEPLLKSLKTKGFTLDISTSKTLSKSLDKIQMDGNSYLNTLVRMLTTRCLEQAIYFGAGDVPKELFRHYGLATPIYTHFTSPIRRYADVLVHRFLGCSLGIYPLTETITELDRMKKVSRVMNSRHRQAQYASRSSAELYTLFYFKDKQVIETAYINRVKQNAVVVFIPRYGIEGIVYITEKADAEISPFDHDEDQEILTLKNDKKIKLQVFDVVKVKIYVSTSKNYRRKLVIEVVEPKIPSVHNNEIKQDDTSSQKGSQNEIHKKRKSQEQNAETTPPPPASKKQRK